MGPISHPSEPLYSTLSTDPDLGELVQLFVEEMPDRVAALRKQVSAADWETLRRTAHQMKGSAGSYGFDPISASAAVLEDAVRGGQDERQILEAVEALIEMCNRARAGTNTISGLEVD
jgi:histidine phosphotransfer protein HptB